MSREKNFPKNISRTKNTHKSINYKEKAQQEKTYQEKNIKISIQKAHQEKRRIKKKQWKERETCKTLLMYDTLVKLGAKKKQHYTTWPQNFRQTKTA